MLLRRACPLRCPPALQCAGTLPCPCCARHARCPVWLTYCPLPALCRREKDESTTQAALGFKICGMQVGWAECVKLGRTR